MRLSQDEPCGSTRIVKGPAAAVPETRGTRLFDVDYWYHPTEKKLARVP